MHQNNQLGDSAGEQNRRRFLKQAASVAATVAAVSEAQRTLAAEPSQNTLPTIALGPHQITRLILGGNPVYGYSHFNRILSRYQTDWHTPDRVQQLLHRAEEVGINTWQNSYAQRTMDDLDRYRQA